jgi:hypothetical protein
MVTNTDDMLFREIERNRMSQRATRKREKHANEQLRYRERLKHKGAPTRADIAVVVLGVLLLALKHRRHDRVIRLLLKMVKHELALAGFDPEQVLLRIERMIENCDLDLPNWREAREWRKADRERKKQLQRSST